MEQLKMDDTQPKTTPPPPLQLQQSEAIREKALRDKGQSKRREIIQHNFT